MTQLFKGQTQSVHLSSVPGGQNRCFLRGNPTVIEPRGRELTRGQGGPATGSLPGVAPAAQVMFQPHEGVFWALLLWFPSFRESERDKDDAELGCKCRHDLLRWLGPYLCWTLARLWPTPPLRLSQGGRGDNPSPTCPTRL